MYTVLISPAASRALGKLPAGIRAHIDRAILALADNPRPPGSSKLKGTTNGWRVRVGDYRILYTIEDDRLTVLVVDVGNRKDVYRGL